MDTNSFCCDNLTASPPREYYALMPHWQEEIWEVSDGEHVPLALSDFDLNPFPIEISSLEIIDLSTHDPQKQSLGNHGTMGHCQLMIILIALISHYPNLKLY